MASRHSGTGRRGFRAAATVTAMAVAPLTAASRLPVARYRDRGLVLVAAAGLVLTAHVVDVAQADGANWPALTIRVSWAIALVASGVAVLRLSPSMEAASVSSAFVSAGAYLALLVATGGAGSPLLVGAYPIAMLLPILLHERLAAATAAAVALSAGALAVLLRDGASPGTLLAWAHVSVVSVAVGVFAGRAHRAAQRALERQRRARDATVAELNEALQSIRTLSGLLRICMHCKRIRDEHGEWERLEAYVATRTEASFSHGLCPDCFERHYPAPAPDRPEA